MLLIFVVKNVKIIHMRHIIPNKSSDNVLFITNERFGGGSYFFFRIYKNYKERFNFITLIAY